jgi:hypothetical protein
MWWKSILLVVTLALIFVFRKAVLTGMASLLVVDDPIQQSDYLLVLGGDQVAEKAAELYQQGTISQILVIEHEPNRLQRMGVLPKDGAVLVKSLLRQDIAKSSINVVPARAKGDWDVARSLQEWLATKPTGTRVLICCGRLESRRLSWLLDQVLDREYRDAVIIHSLHNGRFDETNWWHQNDGIVNVCNSVLLLGYVGLIGEDKTAWHEWEPDDYEAALLANVGQS